MAAVVFLAIFFEDTSSTRAGDWRNFHSFCDNYQVPE